MSHKVPVFDEYGEVIAQVEYNENLDFWDGNNHTCGSTGRHMGLTKLASGNYVLIHGTQWQGESDTAEIVSAKQALSAILRSGNDELLEEEKFKDLKELMEESLDQEV